MKKTSIQRTFLNSKYYYLLACLLLIPGYCDSQWTWLNPLPQGNSLKAMQFVSSTIGYAIGDGGTVLKTTDRGNTWIRLNTGVLDNLVALSFVNPQTGYIVGNSVLLSEGFILKTSDGGNSWLLYWPPYGDLLYAVFFTDADTGY